MRKTYLLLKLVLLKEKSYSVLLNGLEPTMVDKFIFTLMGNVNCGMEIDWLLLLPILCKMER